MSHERDKNEAKQGTAFELGANGSMSKPIHNFELVARINAILRRKLYK